MDYKKARQTRGKSLLQLIAEKKFKEGEGIGASIGGAISDKFKARAMGFKEKFDPLNIVRGLTGKGTFGHIATTLAGRAMGRSENDIKYFGGFARKNKARLDNSKKDPLLTTVGAGAVVKLRTGDGIATIMGKLYNFMEKNQEINKRNYELEVAFRKEQIDEDERRHKKLIDSILNRTDTQKQAEPEDEVKSFIDRLLEGIKTTFAGIMSGIGSGLSMLGGIGTAIMSFLVKNVGLLIGLLTPGITDLIKFALSSFVGGIVRALGGVGLRVLAGPLGVGLAAFGIANTYADYANHMDEVYGGPEWKAARDKGVEEQRKILGTGEGGAVQNAGNKNQQISNIVKQTNDLQAKIIKEREEKIIGPGLAKHGYFPTNEKQGNRTIYRNENGETPPDKLIAEVVGDKTWAEQKIEDVFKLPDLGVENPGRALIEKASEIDEEIRKKLKPNTATEPESKVTVESSKESASLIPELKTPDVFNQGSGGSSTYVASTTNNIGGTPPKIYDMGVTSMRNEDVPVRAGFV